MKESTKKSQARLARKLSILARIPKADNSDVDGSYTGTSRDGSPPTQDADDL